MWHTGIDTMSGQPIRIAPILRDRHLRRALTQFFRPRNYFEVREALLEAGRAIAAAIASSRSSDS
jgi:hypothetical protein